VQTFTRTAGVITDSFVAGDVLHIGIGDGVNAPVCYIALASASPATGTMAINTVGMVALFAATSANQLTLNVGVVRTRGGSTNTIFSAPIVIHRSVIDPDTAVPTPSILGTGVAAALKVAINTALGFVRLDASARYPALDGSQITNLAGGSLTVGTTAIASGTSGRILYDNAGVLGELPVGTGVATALAVNVGSAGAFLTSAVTSITGTANEITVTGTTTPTLSLPSALTFTSKTVTGGTFASPTFTTPALGTPASGDFSTGAFTWPTFDQNTTGSAGSAGSAATLTTTRTIGGANFNGSEDVTSFPAPGAIGGTTPSTIAGTTGTFSGELSTTGTNAQIYTSGAAAYLATYGAAAHIYTDGADAQIYTSGLNGRISTGGANAHISTGSSGAYIQSRSTFRLNSGTFITTLSHAPTTDRSIAFPDAAGTLALTSDITGGTRAGSFTTLTASSTTSLLLGTAGTAVGNIGFRNATSGTTTLAPATGALGTGTVTLPLSGTLATLEGANTFTAANVCSLSPGASASALSTTGAIYAAGTGTTNFPHIYINESGATASSSWSTTGTALGINLNTTSPKFIDCKVDGTAGGGNPVSYFEVDGTGNVNSFGALYIRANSAKNLFQFAIGTSAATMMSGFVWQWAASSSEASGTKDLTFSRQAAGILQIGTSSANALGSLGCLNIVAGGTLAVTGASTLTGLLTANGGITLGDGQNIAFNTTTGTKIGATTSQKLSFWNATPIVQPTTAVASATVAHTGGGTNIKTDDTFDGYTIAQVVKALRNAGLLA
jgi:hypothetical protein